MTYPTDAEIESADHVTLARWYRFLRSPGMSVIDHPNATERERIRVDQMNKLDRIIARFNGAGGWTPAISKTVGWE